MKGNRKFHVCWLMDQRPGHLTKVKGVLKALACHIDLDVERIQVAWKPRFLRTLVPRVPGFPVAVCLDRSPVGPLDLVVSAGGATEWPNAKIARSSGVPNIYLGSLRTCSESSFTVLPRIESGSERVLEMDLVPSEMESAMVAEAAAKELGCLKERYWAVLLGGDGSGCVWTREDLAKQARRIIEEARKAGVRLMVTDSRRTGLGNEDYLRELFESSGLLEVGAWHARRDMEHQPGIPALLGKAERVIVTEDSASMVNEAVAAGKPVATISPEISGPDALVAGMLDRLESKKRIVRLRGCHWNLAEIPENQWMLIEQDWHRLLGARLLARIKPSLLQP